MKYILFSFIFVQFSVFAAQEVFTCGDVTFEHGKSSCDTYQDLVDACYDELECGDDETKIRIFCHSFKNKSRLPRRHPCRNQRNAVYCIREGSCREFVHGSPDQLDDYLFGPNHGCRSKSRVAVKTGYFKCVPNIPDGLGSEIFI